MKLLQKKVLIGTLIFLAFTIVVSCNIKPTDPGKAKGNLAPETFISPTPPEGSENNPFRIRIQWHGNDPDGRIVEYQYRMQGPLHDNTWQSTKYFFQDFKLRNGWYTIEVRAVDDDGVIDETPVSRRFHVLGPTFDKGILLVDDDNMEDDDRDDRKDVLYDSLMIRAGYTEYTVWDYETKFGITESPVFAGTGVDQNEEEYIGMSAYSTVIWYTGKGGENNISKNERLFIDFLDMGGNLWISGMQPMLSITGTHPTGLEFAANSLARKYLHIRKAKVANMKVDYLLGVEQGYPTISTTFTLPGSGRETYIEDATDQIIPYPDADPLYKFSAVSYVYDAFSPPDTVNAEEFLNSPCAIRYRGNVYTSVVFGFPLVRATKRGRRNENNMMNEDAMVRIVRNVLFDEFGEQPNY